MLINIKNTRAGANKRNWLKFTCWKCQTIQQGNKSRAFPSVQDFPIWNNKGSLSHRSSESDQELPMQCCLGKGETHHWEHWEKRFPWRKCWCQAPGSSWVLSFQRQLLAAVHTPMDMWRINSALSRITAWGISRGMESCNLRGDCKFASWLVPGDENEEELWLLSMNISEDQQRGKRQFKLKGYWQKYKWV